MGRKSKELTIAEKNAVVSLHKAGVKGLDIVRLCKKPKSTVYDLLHRFQERESLENRPRSGRPKALTDHDKRQMFRLVRENRRRSLKEITNIFSENGPVPVSESTVNRALTQEGYFRRVVKKKMRIRQENKKKRLVWCRRERSKTVNEYWRNVIFSDECKVKIGTDRKVYIWRKVAEEWEPNCIDPPTVRVLVL